MEDFCLIFGMIAGAFIGAMAVYGNFYNDKQEGAMEVYRGNTTLEYKVVDGVKVDSCVIFKNK